MTPLGGALVALLAAASLPSCLIPEPDANHDVSEARTSPPIFSEEPGPASEPDLGLPPAPPPTVAPAQPAAEPTPAGAEPQSSASSATQTEAAAPAPSEATASSTETGKETAHTSSTQSPPDQQQPGAQGAPQTQDPSPPDLPTEPATAAGDNANPPALANAPKEVLDLLDRYYTAFSTGQWTVAAQCFWDSATFVSVRSPGNGEPAQVLIRPAREVFDEFISGKRALESVEGKLVGKPQVLRTGDVSHAWCRYEAKYGTPTDAMSWRRIDSVTLVLHEDVWKIACLVQSRSVDLP